MMDAHFASALLTEFGSPAYLYDSRDIDRRAAELQAALPLARILYSIKANPLPAIVQQLVDRGLDLEVSSEGELGVALSTGCGPGRVLATGPAKSEGFLRAAFSAGITWFSCESPVDYERIGSCAEGRPIDLLIRLNPEESASAGLSMSGTSTQFGFSEKCAFDFAATLAVSPAPPHANIHIHGIHIYYGSQMRDPQNLSATFQRIERAALDFERFTGIEASVVDFGGGFPWPHGKSGDAFDLGAVRFPDSGGRPGRSQWFESGRYLVASCGLFAARVIDIKESRGKQYVVLDAGINHFGGMPALGRLNAMSPDVILLRGNEYIHGASSKYQLVGPLCSPLDVIGRDIAMPSAKVDDVILIPNVGAYGATASLTGFLSHAGAVEVLHDGGSVLAAYRLRGGHFQLR